MNIFCRKRYFLQVLLPSSLYKPLLPVNDAECVFSPRFSSEKCPTITVASFFFVRPQTSDRVPLFSTDFNRLTVISLTQWSRFRVLALARNFLEHLRKRTRLKGSLFQFFEALCEFSIFFCLQRVPLRVF